MAWVETPHTVTKPFTADVPPCEEKRPRPPETSVPTQDTPVGGPPPIPQGDGRVVRVAGRLPGRRLPRLGGGDAPHTLGRPPPAYEGTKGRAGTGRVPFSGRPPPFRPVGLSEVVRDAVPPARRPDTGLTAMSRRPCLRPDTGRNPAQVRPRPPPGTARPPLSHTPFPGPGVTACRRGGLPARRPRPGRPRPAVPLNGRQSPGPLRPSSGRRFPTTRRVDTLDGARPEADHGVTARVARTFAC